ncbi:MAG TPA: CHAP domain-containing protein [Candidatus Saccharimonadales bacterium]
MLINKLNSNPATASDSSGPRKGRFSHIKKRLLKTIASRRFVRYGLLTVNVLLLGGIIIFVLQSNPSNDASHQNAVRAVNGGNEQSSDPLDQLSTAEIAVNLAQMTNLAETPAVTNQADSASTMLTVPVQSAVIAKPQAVATELKSSKDIVHYNVLDGDTVASIAAKFNVTSESIVWSNGLSGNSVAVGTRLVIPPVNGIVYTVKQGDNPDTLAQKYRASKDQIIAYNDAELGGLKLGQLIIIPNGLQPVATGRGSFSSGLGGSYSPVYGYNGYDRGFCTWYVADRRAAIGRPLPSNLGDAWTWDDRAAAAGIRVDNSPAIGAAIVTNTSRRPGHVAIVEAVNEDGSVWISEMNSRGQRSMTDATPAGGFNRVDYKLIPASQARGYNYIH